MTAIPATAHTLPGRYFPRLEMVQILAAAQGSSLWPQAPSIERHAAMSRAYMTQTTAALSTSHPAWGRQSSGWARSWSQFRTRDRQANTTMASPTIHCPARNQRLPTQRLVIPALAQLGHVVRSQPGSPGFADQTAHRHPVRIVEQLKHRGADRFARRKDETSGAARGHDVQDTTTVPACDHRNTRHQRLRRRQSEAFSLGRKDHDIRAGEMERDVGRGHGPGEV